MAKNRYTPERVARLVKNPGTRASVPTKYLPAEYRKQRELNTRLAQPVTPGSSLTNRDAARERDATVEQRYGPLDQQLNQQLQRSQQTQQAIPQWYEQYRQLLGAAQSGVQQGYQAAVQQFQGLQAGTQAAQGQQQLQGYQQQAQQLGQVADPAAAQTAANAAQVRGAMAGNIGSVVAAQGANANAYGAQQVGNTGQHQIESLLAELNNERDVRDDQAQLGREKGAYSVTTDQGIKDRERKSVLENQAFGLQVANTQADNARADASETRQAQQDERSASEATAGPGGTYSKREWSRMTSAQRTKAWADYRKQTGNGSGGGGGSGDGGGGDGRPKPATGPQRNSANSAISYARQVARAAKGKNVPRSKIAAALVAGQPARSKVDEKKYQELLDKGEKPADARRKATRQSSAINKTDQFWASVALDVEYDGHLSRNNQRKLQSMGYSVRDLGLPSYGDRPGGKNTDRPTSINGRPHG